MPTDTSAFATPTIPSISFSRARLRPSCWSATTSSSSASMDSRCARRNARAMLRAKQLGGEIKSLRPGEIDARARGYSPYSTETWRAWEYWANKAGCGHLLTRPDAGHDHGHDHKKK